MRPNGPKATPDAPRRRFQRPDKRAIVCFVQGLFSGIGGTLFVGGIAWLIGSKVKEGRYERTLPRRLQTASNQDSFTLGDYSGIYGNADFRAQVQHMEDSYAARQRNQQTIQDSLNKSDMRGRTEMKPWLEVE